MPRGFGFVDALCKKNIQISTLNTSNVGVRDTSDFRLPGKEDSLPNCKWTKSITFPLEAPAGYNFKRDEELCVDGKVPSPDSR